MGRHTRFHSIFRASKPNSSSCFRFTKESKANDKTIHESKPKSEQHVQHENMSKLNEHIAPVHEREKLFKCKNCVQELNEHILSVHEGLLNRKNFGQELNKHIASVHEG